MQIKVAHVITRLDFGGAQQNTLYTVRTLDRANFDPLLISGVGGYFDADARTDASIRTIFVPSLIRRVNPFKDLIALYRLINLFRTIKVDVVHTHSSKAGILGRIAAKLAGVPTIVHTYHGFGFHDRQNRIVKYFYVSLERLCAKITTQLIFVSRANAKYARKNNIGRTGNVKIIRSGVLLTDFPASVNKDALKMSARIGRHSKLVISIGNFKPQKNPGDFIAAAAITAKAVPDACFVFLGGGMRRDAFEAKAFAEGLNDRLIFLGWRRDAAKWLAAADVFALTSLWEGLPRALLEAMRTGLPSVCYATDGVTDVLKNGKNGFLIEPGDVEAFAEKLTRLLTDDSLRNRLGTAARESIGQEFDIGGMVRAQEALYLKLTATAHRG